MRSFFLLVILTTIISVGFCQNELFISEYVHGTGNNRAIELYNPTSTDIILQNNNYALIRYSNGGTTPYSVQLSGTIPAGGTYVVVSDKRDPNAVGMDTMISTVLLLIADTFVSPVYSANRMMYYNGNDAIALSKNNIIIDLVGVIGQDPGLGWTADFNSGFTSSGGATAWTKRHTLIRKNTVQSGVTTNPSYFNPSLEWDSLPMNTFSNLGSHNFGLINIDSARNIAVNATVKIEGIITTLNILGNNSVTIQDTSAAITVYSQSLANNTNIGDIVNITGIRADYNQLQAITNISNYNVISSGNTLPTPIILSISQLNEDYESQLVTINDVSFNINDTVFSVNNSYSFSDYSGTTDLYNYINSKMLGITIPINQFTITGIVDHATIIGVNNGYRLVSRDCQDFNGSGVFINKTTITKCFGDTCIWRNNIYSDAGNYYDTLQNKNGCDSICMLEFIIDQSYITIDSIDICSNTPYAWRGYNISNSGLYYDFISNSNSCDSIFELRLTLKPYFENIIFDSIYVGDSIQWRGNWYSQAGVFNDNFVSYNGCDSIYSLQLNYYDSITDIRNIESEIEISLYPNPNNGIFGINLNSSKNTNLKLVIHNSLGQIIISEKIGISAYYSKQFDFRDKAKGVYYIKVSSEKGVYYRNKIVIY